ncbi:PREDICTED: serine-rich adhesin for platelets [Rhagoletis zephyria]|uniref:serine-rich adhesin for platelets n=1 Tax=Rhagoletis zephyria TaxID=28612 RepID=UPI00081144E8|nr:PREDICTED: serine-rich adhesin for platelets [Rhagoletis zephyria]
MSADIQIISVIGANGQPLPIHGNSIGSNWSAPVKQERADEAEIQELAAKMMETQKAALAKQQQQAAQLATRQQVGGMQAGVGNNNNNGQANILNYLTRQQKLPNGTSATAANGNGRNGAQQNGNGSSGDATGEKKAPCDEESQKGHFGWTTFGKTYIPYIYRQQEKYCSVRMIEMKLLGKYLNCLHPDIYSSCTCVRSYYITEAEARLLIEINIKHCDGEFGRDIFTQKDLVVRLSDATKFYQFLDICYRKLISGSKSPSEKCGFIRINKESVVPYTVRNNEQVVPLFYFEGETENLKQKADYLSGWDLAYLKFCCKVQGIRNELFSSENVAVISLTDIKSYFPNGTEFEDYWPSKVVDSNLLIGNRTNANNSVNWTRQPTQPPPKVMPQSSMLQKQTAAAAAAAQQQQMMKRGANAYATQSSAAAAAAAAAAAMQQQQPGQRMHPSNAALATVQALTNTWMQQQPLIHAQMLASQAQQSHPNSRAPQYQRSPMENILLGNRPTYAAYNNPAISMQPVNSHNQANAPPPLVRSGAGQSANHMSNVEQTMLQQQTQQQQRHTSSSSSRSPSASSHASASHTPSSQSLPLSHVHAAPGAPSASASPYNFNFPSTAADMAFWNQLTPAQRLLLTQQIKSNGTVSGAVAATSTERSNSLSTVGSLGASKAPGFPIFPSLPLDTDLKTMLDYNPHKHSNKNSTSTCTTNNGQFTKPSVPPLIPVSSSAEAPSKRSSTSTTSSSRHTSSSSLTSSSGCATVPLNSTASLEDFEKKFKMTDEMKAVVQKVLSNPDLSTFIQTNSSQNFVPFMSPPISPAPSLSIVPNPNVTITPHIPSQYSHSSHSSASGGSSSGRQKSVICSTSAALNVPPSPSTSNSTSTPSPSPTRSHGSSASSTGGTGKSGSHYSSQHYNSHQNHHSSHHHHHHSQNHSHHQQNHHQNTPPMEVIDLSSPRRSVQAASAYLQQQQEAHQAAVAVAQQQQRMAAAAQHHAQQNGRASSSSSANANSASMHLQRHAAMAAAAAANNAQRLSIIPEMQQYERAANNMGNQPYKVQKVYVDNRLVPCINMKAYNDSDQLMTLTDFQKNFFPHESLENCKVLIETLGVELYKGNRRQLQVLMENDRSHNENIPLVQVRDVMKYMKQLLFMTRNQEQPPSKRTRIS